MRCPNCGAKIRKSDDRCVKCGTKMNQIQGASSARVRQAKKEFQPELVVNSTYFPDDLSYKKALLLCIFLGWVGAHCYYVKRYVKGAILTIMTIIFWITALPFGVFMQTGDAGIFNPLVSFLLDTSLLGVIFSLGSLTIIIWAVDIIKLFTRTFPVPVVLREDEVTQNEKRTKSQSYSYLSSKKSSKKHHNTKK